MTLKRLIQMMAKDHGLNLESLGHRIGRPFHSLGQSLRHDSLKTRDLKRIYDELGEELSLPYKGKRYLITNKTKRNEKSI